MGAEVLDALHHNLEVAELAGSPQTPELDKIGADIQTENAWRRGHGWPIVYERLHDLLRICPEVLHIHIHAGCALFSGGFPWRANRRLPGHFRRLCGFVHDLTLSIAPLPLEICCAWS